MKTIYDRVKILLEKYPEARELKNRKRLEWHYWRTYDGLKEVMKKDDYLQMTPVETIDRAWRKVLEKEYPNLPREDRDIKEFETRNESQLIDAEYIEKEMKKEFKRSGKLPSEIAKEALNKR